MTDCIEWTGPVKDSGYGRITIARRTRVPAHRYYMERHLGRKLGPKEIVCHTCDNKLCINVDHLYIGDRSTNMQDWWDRQATQEQRVAAGSRLGQGAKKFWSELSDEEKSRRSAIANRAKYG